LHNPLIPRWKSVKSQSLAQSTRSSVKFLKRNELAGNREIIGAHTVLKFPAFYFHPSWWIFIHLKPRRRRPTVTYEYVKTPQLDRSVSVKFNLDFNPSENNYLSV
jgi:hypothetical protein